MSRTPPPPQLALPAVRDAVGEYREWLTKRLQDPGRAKEMAAAAAVALQDGLAQWTEPEFGTPPRPVWESEAGDHADERGGECLQPSCERRCPWFQPVRYRQAVELSRDMTSTASSMLMSQPVAGCAHPARIDPDTAVGAPCWPALRSLAVVDELAAVHREGTPADPCHSCIATDAIDCAGLRWGAEVVEADEDMLPGPGDWDGEPCGCPCHPPVMQDAEASK